MPLPKKYLKIGVFDHVATLLAIRRVQRIELCSSLPTAAFSVAMSSQPSHSSAAQPQRPLEGAAKVVNSAVPAFPPAPESGTPHRFANVNVGKPREYWDYDSLRISWSSPDRYVITQKIGRGKYSDVFLGEDTTIPRRVVIKVLKPVKKKKIQRELRVLQILRGGPNIVELYDVVRDPGSRTPSFVFEHVDASDFRVIFPTLSDRDVRHYMYLVLQALEYAHAAGIMHRDVKPNNVCIDHRRRTLKLIDWGLAEFYHPETSYNARVASRYFKGPELLVELPMYDYRLDMWSLGCMFAGIIFMKEPFFRGRDNVDQLVRIVRVLGTSEFSEYLHRYHLHASKLAAAPALQAIGVHNKKTWDSFVTEQNRHLCPPEALDLLDKLLRYDHTERVDATSAMKHPYFDPVREAVATSTEQTAATSHVDPAISTEQPPPSR